MIKTKQTPLISRFWQNVNKNWGVAVGFLMLLFIIPAVVIVTNTNTQYTTISNADTSKPLVKISPANGQGNDQLFVAEVSDTDVDRIEYLDLWFSNVDPSANVALGNYATISLKNFSITDATTTFDWRALVYTKIGGNVSISTALKPDDNSKSELGKVYSIPTVNAGEVNLASTDTADAVASIKFRKIVKTSASNLQFYFQVNFKDIFAPKDTMIYMKSQRGINYGGATSSIGSSEWTNVGIWNAGAKTTSYLVANQPPRITSVPSSKATVGVQYKYTITATDPNNDSMTYKIFSSPAPLFLNLSGNVLSGVPTSSDVGAHPIIISVTDKYGNVTTQSWTINVASATTTTPTQTLTITAPAKGATFTGKTNTISWTITPSTSGISSFKISYAIQGNTNYTQITTVDVSKTSYVWDVTSGSLASGTYTLKIEALGSAGTAITTATSEAFTVNSTSTTTTVKPPSLYGLTPEDGSTPDSKKPKISASIKAGSADIDMTTLKVYLDGTSSTNEVSTQENKDRGIFSAGTDSFTYDPPSDLTDGNHIVTVKVAGKDAKKDTDYLNFSWSFTIQSQIAGTNNSTKITPGDQITLPIIGLAVPTWLGTIIIGLFVIILFAILVFAIILLIRVLRSGKEEDEMSQISKYYQHDSTPAALETTVTTTTTEPEQLGGPFAAAEQAHFNLGDSSAQQNQEFSLPPQQDSLTEAHTQLMPENVVQEQPVFPTVTTNTTVEQSGPFDQPIVAPNPNEVTYQPSPNSVTGFPDFPEEMPVSNAASVSEPTVSNEVSSGPFTSAYPQQASDTVAPVIENPTPVTEVPLVTTTTTVTTPMSENGNGYLYGNNDSTLSNAPVSQTETPVDTLPSFDNSGYSAFTEQPSTTVTTTQTEVPTAAEQPLEINNFGQYDTTETPQEPDTQVVKSDEQYDPFK